MSPCTASATATGRCCTAALAGGVFVLAARARMWQTGLGELVWFVLVGFVVYALLEVYRHWRSY